MLMRIGLWVVLVLLISGANLFPSRVYSISSSGLTWGTPDYANLVETLLTPDDSSLQLKLRSIAPFQDVAHFGQNLLNVYLAASHLPVGDQPDWMSASEILQYGRGDCKNHAILLATLIEALYKNTFGNLPTDLVWVQGGGVGQDPNNPGWHVWVLLNLDEIQAVSTDAFSLITKGGTASGSGQEPVGAEPPWSTVVQWIAVNFDSLPNRFGILPSQSILQLNHLYIELEATWGTPIGEFYNKKYPYIEQYLHDQWNSYEYHKSPQVIPPGGGSLQLSSNNWHYGDVIRWSASGLTPNGVVSIKVQASWGVLQFWDTAADAYGKAGYSFTVGTNIPGSGQFIVVDRIRNTFQMATYQLLSSVGSQSGNLGEVKVNVFSVDLVNIGKDPAQQADIGAVISVTFVNAGKTETVFQKTPFNLLADPFSMITLSVSSAPSGYGFANQWDDFGISRHTGPILSYNVLAIVDHKTAAFFNVAQLAIAGISLQLSSTGWHYGDTITWSGHGLTPNGVISVRIEGTWGRLQIWDVTADSSGSAGYSFNVGMNILGSGQIIITDASTGATAQTSFSMLNQQATGPSLQLSTSTWRYGDTVTWSAQGLTPNAVIQVMVRGNWGVLRFWDVTADASGRAGFSFTVGTNIQGSGQFVIIDTGTGNSLTHDYALTQ